MTPGATRCLVLVPALTGAAVMILEMMAVRALAPVFGASTIVWTNVLGVVMLALAVGYAIGGRLADDPTRRRRAFRLLPIAIALTVPAATAVRPVAKLLLPARMPLEHFDLGATEALGTFAVALLIFGPPVTLLAMVGPLVVAELVGLPGSSLAALRSSLPTPESALPLPGSSLRSGDAAPAPPHSSGVVPGSEARAPAARAAPLPPSEEAPRAALPEAPQRHPARAAAALSPPGGIAGTASPIALKGEAPGSATLQRGIRPPLASPPGPPPRDATLPAGTSDAGAAAGRVLASGTLGSLAGTYLTSYVFLDDLGVTLTAGVAAVAILLATVCARIALGPFRR